MIRQSKGKDARKIWEETISSGLTMDIRLVARRKPHTLNNALHLNDLKCHGLSSLKG